MDELRELGIDYDDPAIVGGQFDSWHARLRKQIDKRGWHSIYVNRGFAVPPLAYTIGLTDYKLPELVVYGLDAPSSARLLNTLGDAAWGGRNLATGRAIHYGDAPGEQVRCFAVDQPRRLLLRTVDFYSVDAYRRIRALHAVYPDAEGRYPWEPGCQLVPGNQPLPAKYAA